MIAVIFGSICLVWFTVILSMSITGYVQIYRNYRAVLPRSPLESATETELPHVTVIRPVKGLEPCLYDCLASTFYQTYPRNNLSVRFCVSDRNDPALPTLRQLCNDFSQFDVKIFIEQDDPQLQKAAFPQLGPNPKIRNMSRAYREAKGAPDALIWVLDCNVWVAKGVATRMVDTLCGFQGRRPYKFVHQLPLVVDVTAQASTPHTSHISSTSTQSTTTTSDAHLGSPGSFQHTLRATGGRLEELFMSSAHAKFYTAINTILLAPCIVGKSNMYRRTHLDYLTSSSPTPGIDAFSHNICEDHLIGDLLWRGSVPRNSTYANHALVFGDLALQPMARMSVAEYIARRVRWLRVRKFTVPVATLVEPGSESFVAAAAAAHALTSLPCFAALGVSSTWPAFAAFWLLIVAAWATADRTLYIILHGMASVEHDANTPAFASPPALDAQRSTRDWALAWLGREALALPVWLWAIFGGASVTWRGQRFRVGLDMRVHSLDNDSLASVKRRD